jgi:hypothetical protein
MCLSFLNITAPIKEVEIPSDDSGEFDRCPVEAVQTFTF